ncbi:MAG: tyrosine-type recombinase/integrase, partial [Bacteroidota bacterium]
VHSQSVFYCLTFQSLIMPIKAVLWNYTRKDGTRDIKIYVAHQGQKAYHSTGIKVLPENWDEESRQIKGTPTAGTDNIEIASIILDFQRKLNDGISVEQLANHSVGKSFLAYLAKFIEDAENGVHQIKAGTIKHYRVVLKRLLEYCKYDGYSDLNFDQLNMEFYAAYYKYLLDNGGGRVGFGSHIKKIKKLMRMSHHSQLHNNQIYLHPDFKVIRGESQDKIYLTMDEIGLLESVDLRHNPPLDRERDRFLLAFYFVMRWEDSVLFSKDFIREDRYIDYRSKKTGIQCVVPISSKAKVLLEKNNYQFNHYSNQEANRKIKEIAAMAGINQMVEQGGKRAPKFKFVTTHTARRSAATNLALSGLSLETIMKLGGWKEIRTLQLYLRASAMDIAKAAELHPFFK